MAPEDFQPLRSRMWIAVLSLVGLFISLYLLAHSLGLMGPVLCGIGDCAAVEASPYSKIRGFPVSALGVGGYLALVGASLAGLQPRFGGARVVSAALVVGGSIGFGFSLYLTYLEAYVIHAWCQWCVTSAILMTIIFGLALPEVSRLRRAQ